MSELPQNGPVASKFVFLHEVSSLGPGTKVRLLGCIVQYEATQGRALLEHAYPNGTGPIPRIWVDLTLVLESTNSTTLAAGTWTNVIGYTQALPRTNRRKSGTHVHNADLAICLQAVLIWDAGPVRLGEYERALEEQRSTQWQM